MLFSQVRVTRLSSESTPGEVSAAYAELLAGSNDRAVGVDTECSGSIIQIASATHVVVHDIVTQPRSRVADLKAILENKHILKVFFASVDDVKHLRALGIDVSGYIDVQTCTARASDLRPHSLMEAWNRCNVSTPHVTLVKAKFGERGFCDIPAEVLIVQDDFVLYAAADAWITYLIASELAIAARDAISQTAPLYPTLADQAVDTIVRGRLRTSYVRGDTTNQQLVDAFSFPTAYRDFTARVSDPLITRT